MRRKHLRVSVPWPAIVLSPNARVHWAKKRTEVQKARNYAYWETCSRAHGERAVQDTYSNESGTTEAKITADLSRIDILCLDDVAADPTTFESKLLTRILDARYRNDRPTLIVTNLSIREKCGKHSEFDAFVGNLVASRVHECATFVDCTTTDFRRGLKQRKVDQNN